MYFFAPWKTEDFLPSSASECKKKKKELEPREGEFSFYNMNLLPINHVEVILLMLAEVAGSEVLGEVSQAEEDIGKKRQLWSSDFLLVKGH